MFFNFFELLDIIKLMGIKLEVRMLLIDYVCLLQIGGHHSKEEFAVRGKEPKDEVQIYTWKDATLRELTDLVWTVPYINC